MWHVVVAQLTLMHMGVRLLVPGVSCTSSGPCLTGGLTMTDVEAAVKKSPFARLLGGAAKEAEASAPEQVRHDELPQTRRRSQHPAAPCAGAVC